MRLHYDEKKFKSLITAVNEATSIPKIMLEKDYFVTLFLKHLIEKEPQIIFKGGTCLSKCYKLVNRFSEDIDINLDNVNSQSQGKKKKMKEHIEKTIDEFGFEFLNPEEIRSGWSHNAYKIGYSSQFQDNALQPHIIVETMFLVDTFPVQRMKASSLIYDYLAENGYEQQISEYGLIPFEVTAQSLERTFVDKVFALGTHYLQNRMDRQSRHLYDIHKILPHIKLDKSLNNLFDDVRTAWKNRKGQPDWYAAEDEKDVSKLLKKVINSEAYRKDYENITRVLLYEDVSYEDTIKSLKKAVAFLEPDMEM